MNRNKRIFRCIFLLIAGALCFYVTQGCFRLPIVESIMKRPQTILYFYMHPIIVILLLASSAGIVEETGRVCFAAVFRRFPGSSVFMDGILFGLGHGLMEVWILLKPLFSAEASTADIHWNFVIYERVLAVLFHIAMSVLLFRGVFHRRWYLFLFLAIALHTGFNLVPVFMSRKGASSLLIYTVMTVEVVALSGIIFYRVRRYFKQ